MAGRRWIAAGHSGSGLDRMLDIAIGSVCEVRTERPIFHVTFDDGPHPEVTPRVLDVLDEFEAPATFFVLAEPARKQPGLLREMMERGHEIGLHGRTHVRLSAASWGTVTDEILRAHREVEDLIGRPVTVFRPPYGAHGLRSRLACWSRRLTTVLWSVDTEDWKGLSRDNPLQGNISDMAPGGIALVHDTPVGKSIAEEAAQGLVGKDTLSKALLTEMGERGLQPVTLAALLASGRPVRRANATR